MAVDKDKVAELYEGGLNQPQIAERFEVTQSHISKILSQKNIETRKFTKWWSDQEVNYLKQHYPPQCDKEKELLKEKLCVEGRNWKSIKDKAQKLGISRSKEEYINSEENKEVLKKNSEESKIQVDFKQDIIGYIVGVLDSDGYTNNNRKLGLEVNDKLFVDKFKHKLNQIGLNPSIYTRRSNMYNLTATSAEFVQWYNNEVSREDFTATQKIKYVEGLYEGDGTIHKTGSPMICSTDDQFKEFLVEFMIDLGFNCSIQQSGVWISAKDRKEFFESINPIIKGQDYYDDNR